LDGEEKKLKKIFKKQEEVYKSFGIFFWNFLFFFLFFYFEFFFFSKEALLFLSVSDKSNSNCKPPSDNRKEVCAKPF